MSDNVQEEALDLRINWKVMKEEKLSAETGKDSRQANMIQTELGGAQWKPHGIDANVGVYPNFFLNVYEYTPWADFVFQSKPFKCDVCTFECFDLGRFQDHMFIHSNRKPFACTQCSFTAFLTRDIQTHTRLIHKKRKRNDSVANK